MKKISYKSVLIIGMGLIGSSIARIIKEKKIAQNVNSLDNNKLINNKTKKLRIVDKVYEDFNDISSQFDLIFICTPLSSYKNIFKKLNTFVKQPTLVTDVGSTKVSVINDFKSEINNENISFLPAHPIAGLEKSGPEHGFAKLFDNRYCIVTPINPNEKFIDSILNIWISFGMTIEIMEAERHDRVLAMTSHIPQLIAYSVVGTATDLEMQMKDEVIKYSAAGFRDFTRLAGSDPIMWRDVYDKNKEAVLEMLGRFSEDLLTYQKAIRNNDLKFLEENFLKSKKIRKIIEEIGQAGTFDPTEKN